MNPPDSSGAIRVNCKAVQTAHTKPRCHPPEIFYVSEDRLSLGLVMPQTIADHTVIVGV